MIVELCETIYLCVVKFEWILELSLFEISEDIFSILKMITTDTVGFKCIVECLLIFKLFN